MDEWDPIGVNDIPEAADEYDDYIGGILGLICRGASENEIARHLWEIEVQQMGLGHAPLAEKQRNAATASLRKLIPLT